MMLAAATLHQHNPNIVFDLEHVEGIGGNFQSEPQGIARDHSTGKYYATATDFGREVRMLDSDGTTLDWDRARNGSTLTIQDPCIKGGKLYCPRTGNGVTSYLQVYDLDLTYESEIQIPSDITYGTTVAWAHGYWWWCSNSEGLLFQVSEDNSTVVATYDIATGNNYSVSPHYSGIAWYGRYLFGAEHTVNTDLDIWYWDGSTLTLHQEFDTGAAGFDLYNGLSIDEENNVLYATSRTLDDDLQKYNIIISNS